MKYHYDLHIHSILSPCADILLTPNNIFNMAHLKGLSVISITDHNSLKQWPILHQVAASYDMLAIPGVEITMKDGLHVLCYFASFEDAMKFDLILEDYLPRRLYDVAKQGEQILTDIDDLTVSVYPYLLSEPLHLHLAELAKIISKYKHFRVIAHADRYPNLAVAALAEIGFDAVELSTMASQEIRNQFAFTRIPILTNSDAHELTDIAEPSSQNAADLERLTFDDFRRWLNHD